MSKKIFVLLSMLMLAVFFCACSNQNPNTTKLAASFDEAKVKSAAESAIALINSGSFQKLSDTMVRPDLRSKLSADIIKDAVEKTMGKAGNFESFSSEKVAGVEDNSKNSFAVVTVTAKYKNQTVIYTISFDTSMNLVGLFMK